MATKFLATQRLNRMLAPAAKAFAVATGVGLMGELDQAQAAVIYSGPINISIPLTTAGLYINVVTGATGTTPSAVPGWDINPFSSTTLSWFGTATLAQTGYVRGGGSSTTLVDNLALGTLVDATSPGTPNYTANSNGSSETVGATAFLFNSSDNYVGFRFLNESNGLVNYGWLQVSLGASLTASGRAIVAIAYENDGTGIIVGDTGVPTGVPEPSSMALLSLGAAGLAALRRRRNAK